MRLYTCSQCIVIYVVFIIDSGLSNGFLNEIATVPEDSHLNFTELGRKYGHDVTEHEVTTKDGYILTLFNIMGDKKRPVFLMHGIIDTADTFILRGPRSLAITLAAQGYDVWAGNARGNKYGRKHVTLNPDLDKAFWNYTFHEIGMNDVAANIDYVLEQTGQAALTAVGHSQGTTAFYVLGSMKPEYNEKVSVLISLAPVSVVSHIKPPLSLLVMLSPLLNIFITKVDVEELFSNRGLLKAIVNSFCLGYPDNYAFCNTQLFLGAGADAKELGPDFTPVLFGHYPASTSRKNAVHTAQQGFGKAFAQFDYGPKRNLQKYGSIEPPAYNLTKVSMKVALLVGRNDKIATVEDAVTLKDSLPNVVMFHVLRRSKCNHMDFVWGKHMDKYLFPLVLKLISEYG